MTTINPTMALKEEAQCGSLKPGMPADISVIQIVKGEHVFLDALGRNTMRGDLPLEPQLVLKRGDAMSLTLSSSASLYYSSAPGND